MRVSMASWSQKPGALTPSLSGAPGVFARRTNVSWSMSARRPLISTVNATDSPFVYCV